MTIGSKFLALGAAAAVTSATFLAATSPAFAETRSIAVPTADVDLNSPEGVSIIERRISRAADRVCGNYDMRDLTAAGSHRACSADAMEGAFAQLARVTLLANAQPLTVRAALR